MNTLKVVKPEIGHHFFNLPLAVDGAQKLRLRQFPSNGRPADYSWRAGFLFASAAGRQETPGLSLHVKNPQPRVCPAGDMLKIFLKRWSAGRLGSCCTSRSA